MGIEPEKFCSAKSKQIPLLIVCDVEVSHSFMSESNILRQCTSLNSNLVMRPEFIPLCGVRGAGGVGCGIQYTVDKESCSKAGQ